MAQENVFHNIISASEAWISYKHLQDEINPNDIPYCKKFFDAHPLYSTPKNIHADPFAFADQVMQEIGLLSCCILVPGSRFDSLGTRYGRGRGWYDRFLSATPSNWVRIGVADISRVSRQALDRKPWDEPMDWLIIRDGSDWRAIETLARTLTRGQTNDE